MAMILGAVLSPVIGKIIGGVVNNVVTSVLTKHPDVPNSVVPAIVAEVTAQVQQQATPAVTQAVKQDPSINKVVVQANAEPISQSVNVWLGVAGVLSSAGGIVTLLAQHSTDFAAYGTLGATFLTSAGVIIRRVRMQA